MYRSFREVRMASRGSVDPRSGAVVIERDVRMP